MESVAANVTVDDSSSEPKMLFIVSHEAIMRAGGWGRGGGRGAAGLYFFNSKAAHPQCIELS